MQDLDDLALLREYAANNSEAAFAELVSRRVGFVYSSALRQMRDPHLAEEITQAVFIILAKKAGRISEKTILTGWFFKTTRFAALAQIRADATRRQREQEMQMQTEFQSAATDEIWNQMSPLLDEALASLGETDRQAVLLRFFENKSLAEVGNFLGMGEDAARKRVSRALEKLHRHFSKRGVSSTTAMLAGAISANSVQAAPVALAKSVTAVAVAKGVAASTSTLTLIKGALKIMAWSKTKTAIVIGATAILGVGTATIGVEVIRAMHIAHLNALHNVQGTWEGVMPLGAGIAKGDSSMTHVVLKLTKSNRGYSVTADAIEMGRNKILPEKIVYNYPNIEIVLSPRTTTPDTVPTPLTDDDFIPQQDSPLQGYWKGTLGTNLDSLPLDWKIARRADGTFRAEMDNPMQGANGQPASVVFNPPEVKLTLMTGSGMFQGELNSSNTELTGSWLQGGESTPSVFKRSDYVAERASEPVKDYSYASKNNLQGYWKGAWILPIGKVKVSIRYALDIAKLPDGTYAATLANLDQLGNSDPIPASDFQYSPPALHMSWKWADNTKYDGKLENGKIVGTWYEGGGGFPLVFERSR